VSALEALAQAGSAGLARGALVGAWLDARRRDVFAALYRVHDAPPFDEKRLVELDAALVAPPAAVWERWREQFGAPAALVGDGAVSYAGLVSGDQKPRIEAGPPLAPAIGRIAWRRAAAGKAVAPAAIQPLYVRRPDAEIAREARDGTTATR
jgi:tRNA A37 threonylcarbamoyladenosine modification protein TsaB